MNKKDRRLLLKKTPANNEKLLNQIYYNLLANIKKNCFFILNLKYKSLNNHFSYFIPICLEFASNKFSV